MKGAKKEPFNVLFVCVGNTCRSKMAAAIAQDALNALEEGGYKCLSAGTKCVDEKTNSNVDPALQMVGCKTKAEEYTRSLDPELVRGADIIFCLGENVYDHIQKNFSDQGSKIFLYAPSMELVPDPLDLQNFDKEDIDKYGLKGGSFFAYITVATQMKEKLTPALLERPEFHALGGMRPVGAHQFLQASSCVAKS